MLNLKGNSAPYIQYTYARLISVVTKARGLKPKLKIELLANKAETRVLESLICFSDTVAYAAAQYDPNYLANYLFRTANALNAFYETSPIITAEKEIAESRLALAVAGVIVLKNGLSLLGIKLPKKM